MIKINLRNVLKNTIVLTGRLDTSQGLRIFYNKYHIRGIELDMETNSFANPMFKQHN